MKREVELKPPPPPHLHTLPLPPSLINQPCSFCGRKATPKTVYLFTSHVHSEKTSSPDRLVHTTNHMGSTQHGQ